MWQVDLQLIEDWIQQQDNLTIAYIYAAIEKLREKGPALGRPLVDTIKGSTIANLKELRPASSGDSKVRILFVFDPRRNAVMLLAGDKSKGSSKMRWNKWYRHAIPEAEKRYRLYLEEISKGTDNATADDRGNRKS